MNNENNTNWVEIVNKPIAPVKRGRGRPKDAINKGGRPRKEKNGKNLWIPSECLDVVIAIIETTHKNKQVK